MPGPKGQRGNQLVLLRVRVEPLLERDRVSASGALTSGDESVGPARLDRSPNVALFASPRVIVRQTDEAED
jgi:hypothetical protein